MLGIIAIIHQHELTQIFNLAHANFIHCLNHSLPICEF